MTLILRLILGLSIVMISASVGAADVPRAWQTARADVANAVTAAFERAAVRGSVRQVDWGLAFRVIWRARTSVRPRDVDTFMNCAVRGGIADARRAVDVDLATLEPGVRAGLAAQFTTASSHLLRGALLRAAAPAIAAIAVDGVVGAFGVGAIAVDALSRLDTVAAHGGVLPTIATMGLISVASVAAAGVASIEVHWRLNRLNAYAARCERVLVAPGAE